MTFTVVARCERTGRLGIATASELVSVGRYCDGALRSHVGATVTQGVPHPENNALAINLLAQGHAAAHVIEQVRANDMDRESRQIAIVDRQGHAAAQTGAKTAAGSQHKVGSGYVVLATSPSAQDVIARLADTFESHAGADLEERLIRALESVRERAANVRSVALIVFGNHDYSDTDLRVDLHDEPIVELRRVYDEYIPFAAYYEERARHPRQAIPQREFADMLYAEKAKKTS